ncbi:LytR/AlgR family response regulator transcription factor [Hymenobacter crusticola]|uniref:DNA-binding response regulator n=1 Tax=Hymenobacter crusticola TaxID=1770526 RepID=A0A243W625_9BACT|nr:LytTR family DNA-binding domain-containing protein [Hymenobacter crusticola]OUJ68947.1 DNA-binding response regulator [Hymenobacter crusticola]
MSFPVYNCLLVDDEPPAREVLKRYLAKMPMLRLAGECANALQVLPFLHAHPVDLLFLDIHLPQVSGLDLARTLQHPVQIIFTTAYGEHALESYEVAATDYLLKPIRFERFVTAVHKALGALALTGPLAPPLAPASLPAPAAPAAFLYFRVERKMVKVFLHEILYIESLKDYVKLVTVHGPVVTKHSLTALEAMLPATGFVRIHRSFLIATASLRAYSPTHVQVAGTELPIGKLYQREVAKVLATR